MKRAAKAPLKYLGIDFGGKRVGIAVTDDSGMMAFPHGVIQNDRFLYTTIDTLCKEKGIKHIVLGESKTATGEDNPIMEDIRMCQKMLESMKYIVHLESESLSSVEASWLRGVTPVMLDASAAAIILQRFLEKQK
jgi:putative holliday junction resolvase